MLFHRLYESHPGVDLVQVLCEMREKLDASRFEQAWMATVARHEALRSGIGWLGGHTSSQIIHDSVVMPFVAEDWRKRTFAEADWSRFLEEDRELGFVLDEPPLHRLRLVRLGWRRWRFCWTFHHLILDGRALNLVLDEVFATLDRCDNNAKRTSDPQVQFRDYASWHQQQDWAGAESFWRHELAGFIRPNALALAHPPVETTESLVQSHVISFSHQFTVQLRKLATDAGATLNNVLQLAWATLLSRYNQEKDIVMGATRACRHSNIANAQTVVGLLVNTLPLRFQFLPGMTVTAGLQKLRQSWLAMREFENTPLLLIQGWTELQGQERLFASIVNFQDPSWDNQLSLEGGRKRFASRSFSLRGQANYPFVLNGNGGENLTVELVYDRKLFERKAVEGMMQHLCTLLENMCHTPFSPIVDVPMENAPRRMQKQQPFPHRKKCIPALFDEQAALHPEATALCNGVKSMTYEKLRQSSNRLARYLLKCQVQPQDRVMVCMDRGFDLIVSLLAILRVGAIYVPLDPRGPVKWLEEIILEVEASLILTHEKHRERLPKTSIPVVSMNADREMIRSCSSKALPKQGDASDLAYILYTSGSTGKPKGVCVSHRAVVRLVKKTNYISIDHSDTLLQFAPVSFDASTFEIWGSLLNGSRLAIVQSNLIGLDALAQFILGQQVTILWLTCGIFAPMVASYSEQLRHVRQLLTGGDVIPVAATRQALEYLPKCRLINAYGPTENTTFTTFHEMTSSSLLRKNIPIGRPISHTTVYLLDDQLRPQPMGVPGEIYAGGSGVAQGYWADPNLTATKFIPDPFSSKPHARLYRTGDWARWLPDGNLEFLGRMDTQLKIRGFRVEPGEIEAVLTEHPSVAQAIVEARPNKDGSKSLHAWVEKHPGKIMQESDLRRFLALRLPQHMIPVSLSPIVTWPLTANGKINRSALSISSSVNRRSVTEAITITQQYVREIFCQILQVSEMGLHDNFFDMGGHSLKAMQLVASLGQAFGREVPIRLLFQTPTVAAMTEWVTGNQPDVPPALINVIRAGGTQAPLFLIPGGVGGEKEMLIFARLAAYFGYERKIYSFNSCHRPRMKNETVDDIADAYLKELRTVHPVGDFWLLGDCIAGGVAHAMACKLEAQGEPLPRLLLLDTHCPHPHRYQEISSILGPGLPLEICEYIELLASQAPGSYSGPVHLIATEESQMKLPGLGWEPGRHGHFHITTVQGNHDTYIRELAPQTGRAIQSIMSGDSGKC